MLKVCVCLSGEMRAFERGVAHFLRVPDGLDVRYTVSTWRHRGAKLWGAMSAERMRGLIEGNIVDVLPPHWMGQQFLEYLPSLRDVVKARAARETIDQLQLEKYFPAVEAHIEDKISFHWFEKYQFRDGNASASDPYSLSMLYKIWQADLLRRNLESKCDMQFDVIIRARPDLPFEFPTAEWLRCLGPDQLFLDRVIHESRNVGDGLAIGTRAAMEVYSQFFFSAYQRAVNGDWKHIHQELYDYLVGAKLSLQSYPVLGYSPDQLATVSDLSEAISASSHETSARISRVDASMLNRSLQLCAQSSLPDARIIIEHIQAIESSNHLERDSGFFFYCARRLREAQQCDAALVAFLIALPSIRKATEQDFFKQPFAGEWFELVRYGFAGDAAILLEADDYLRALWQRASDENTIASALRDTADRLIGKAELIAAWVWAMQATASEPGYWLWFVDHFLQEARYEDALAVVQYGLSVKPDEHFYLAKAAFGAACLGRSEQCAEFAARACHSEASGPLLCAGQAFLQIGDRKSALDCARRAQAVDRTDAELVYFESVIHDASGDVSEAIAQAKIAADMTAPPLAHRHNHLGLLYRKAGRPIEAEAAFREVISRAPQWDDARMQLSRILAEQGRYREALELEFETAVRLPNRPEIEESTVDWLIHLESNEFSAAVERAQSIWPASKLLSEARAHKRYADSLP